MKRILSWLLACTTLFSIVCVAIPVALIYPFRAQTPSRLALSHALRARNASITMALLVLGVVTVFLLWRRLVSWRGRVPVVFAVALLVVSAAMGRWNHFESMFHPLSHPMFTSAAEATDVSDEDLVLGVRIDDEARAYPVRAMAYHHLVNDLLSTEPIVATY